MKSELFTIPQIDTLRNEFSKISTVDPSLPTYVKLVHFLNKLDQAKLKQLSQSNINFLSKLALNRVNPCSPTNK